MRTNLPVTAAEYFLEDGESNVCKTDLKGNMNRSSRNGSQAASLADQAGRLSQATSVFKLERSSSGHIPVRFQPNRSLAQGNALPWTEQARRSA